MALVSTIGGSDSDSYVSAAEADTYFANHYSSTKSSDWSALTATQKESALRRATQILEGIRVLDNELSAGALPLALLEITDYDLTIHKQFADQNLQVPRNIDIDSNGDAFIPQAFKDAECEQAIYLITFDDSALVTRLQGILKESVQAGPVASSTTYANDVSGSFLSPIAYELIRPFTRPMRRMKRS